MFVGSAWSDPHAGKGTRRVATRASVRYTGAWCSDETLGRWTRATGEDEVDRVLGAVPGRWIPNAPGNDAA